MNVAEEEEEQESEPPPTMAEAAVAAAEREAQGADGEGGDELETVVYGGDTEFSPRYSPRLEVQEEEVFQY